MHLMHPIAHLTNSMTFQIRGVLNKITPEKFEKLTVDILNVGLDSTIVLKGVILLVRETLLPGRAVTWVRGIVKCFLLMPRQAR